MRGAALIGRRMITAAVVGAALVIAVASCDIAGVTGPAAPLDVSMPGSTPRAGQGVVFEGQLVEVDVEHSVLHVPSLEAVAEALGAGEELVAWGHGWERSEEPRTVVAKEVVFKGVE